MMSGAAAAVGSKMHAEARALRCDVAPEDPRFPVQPSCGVGGAERRPSEERDQESGDAEGGTSHTVRGWQTTVPSAFMPPVSFV